MLRYDYRCPDCNLFEVSCTAGTAAPQLPCPRCGVPAARVFSPPVLLSGSSPVARAVAADRRSAYAPDVVNTLPPVSGRPAARRPRHSALPRP
ncbi:zinc ribbon domain-containing protein [Streptomyces xiaopingdaonensis]|uniref:zinc ribbon domain-containing protein n=1 Tax=Streptomyces xiaopingdaonensis TaxID=1565415 RepID=UPI0012FF1CE1